MTATPAQHDANIHLPPTPDAAPGEGEERLQARSRNPASLCLLLGCLVLSFASSQCDASDRGPLLLRSLSAVAFMAPHLCFASRTCSSCCLSPCLCTDLSLQRRVWLMGLRVLRVLIMVVLLYECACV